MKELRAALLLAALALAPLASGAQSSEPWTWSGSVGAGKWVRVVSINGPISVEGSTDGRVHVTAQKRWNRGDPSRVRFEVVEAGGNVTVCALWNANHRCTAEGMTGRGNRSPRGNDVSVQFRVSVPPTANISGTTVNGEVKVSGARNEVRATTVNGGISVGTTGGPVSATTVNGSIHASLGASGRRDMDFTTVNGGIDVSVPRQFSADVNMTTVNGDIRSDFPLSVQGRWGPRSANGTLGSGGADLKMTTVNGSLTLRSM